MINSRAFTLTANKRLAVIKLQVGVTETPSDERLPKKEDIHRFWAIWDTAATRSCISKKVVDQLKLEPVSAVKMHTSAGVVESPSYIVDVFLPNAIRLTPVQVAQVVSHKRINFDVVIGMDIISQGDSSLSYANNQTLFSFRVPSLAAIDFCQQMPIKKQSRTPDLTIPDAAAPKKVQKIHTISAKRNGMCHCGSGNKFKNCCGK